MIMFAARDINFRMRAFLLICSLLASPAFAEVNTYLNRYTIAPQEIVSLTIESTQQGPSSRPDLSVLNQNFYLLGTKKMTISNLQKGNRQATTRWQVLLRPRRSGDLQVPAININGETSQPITLFVTGAVGAERSFSPQAATATAVNTAPSYIESNTTPVMVEVSIDHTEAYEGSQLIYSVKLLHSDVMSKNAGLSEPFINQALILPIGDVTKSEVEYRGQRYFQEEQRYAIFPDEPGTHLIEAPVFSGTTESGHYLETMGEQLQIDVLPRANASSNGYWLPSNNITLETKTSSDEPLTPGKSVIRTITLTAQGIPASRLPSMMVLQNELADIELISADLQETMDDQGLTGIRIETVKITAKERGEITLPPIDIHWWNTYEDRAKVASIPPTIMRVNPAPVNSGSPELAEQKSDSETPSEMKDGTDFEHKAAPLYDVTPIYLLSSICILTSIGWLYTLYQLRRLRKPLKNPVKKQKENTQQKRIVDTQLQAEKNTFDALVSACLQNNPDLAKARLIEWAQHFWSESIINDCEDISRAAQNQTLDFLIIDLEQHLYSTERALWQGDLLQQAIEKLRQRRRKEMRA